jgi:hypothetical protein
MAAADGRQASLGWIALIDILGEGSGEPAEADGRALAQEAPCVAEVIFRRCT